MITSAEITALAEVLDMIDDNFPLSVHNARKAATALRALLAEREGMRERFKALADELDRAAMDRQSWADHPDIGGRKPKLESHLRGKRYGYSHAAQLIRAALTTEGR